jgi:hypothetical protein
MITNVRSYSETRVIQNRCNGEEEGGSREESCLQERVTCVTRSVTLLQLIICLADSHLGVPDPIGYDNYDCIWQKTASRFITESGQINGLRCRGCMLSGSCMEARYTPMLQGDGCLLVHSQTTTEIFPCSRHIASTTCFPSFRPRCKSTARIRCPLHSVIL